MSMFNHSASDKTAFTEQSTNCFETIYKSVYEKSSPEALQALINSRKNLQELLASHPYHPHTKALFAEHVDYLVCTMDYNSQLLLRAADPGGILKNTGEELLLVYRLLNSGWQQACMPANSKLPESFLAQERLQLHREYEAIDQQWQQLQFQLPAAIALEPALKLAHTPEWQLATYSQWLYARYHLFHMQAPMPPEATPVTQEALVKRLLALRYNSNGFSSWFIQDARQKIQNAGSPEEKKSA